MKILKPIWVNHEDLPIFSIDVHPDSTRFATGGQGKNSVGRVAIWNMIPVLDEGKRDDENIPKLLCDLEFHNCVNAVRWSHNGKFLSSGADDKIEIWKCSTKYNGAPVAPIDNAFNKGGYEQWKSVASLHGHKGDILDISWSPNDKYLASASVDNTVIIWDGVNFPHIITTLKGHSSLVKGVTWDPVGKFVASQSDDKTLRIWRTSDWQLEHVVKEPFLECGGTTHVLRLDWSPDGLYLVSAHAMNAGGPTAQIVERTGWKTDKDFVGHRKAVVCVRFNPNILQREGNKSKTCCVALGSRDRSVSIWSAALKRPVVVINDVFTSSVMDLSWSTCGSVLLCCSFDGTVGAVEFSCSEIGKPISQSEVTALHQQTYGNNVLTPSVDIIHDVSILKANAKTSHAKKVIDSNVTSNSKPSSDITSTSITASVTTASTAATASTSTTKADKQTNGIPNTTITTKNDNTKISTNNTTNNNTTTSNNNNNETETAITKTNNEKIMENHHHHRIGGEDSTKLDPMDTTTAPTTSSSSSSTSPIKGPLYKQIETLRNDGKRRITPQFLLPQGNSQGSSVEENNLSNIGNRIDTDGKNNVNNNNSSSSNNNNINKSQTGISSNNLEPNSTATLMEVDNKLSHQQQQENVTNVNDIISNTCNLEETKNRAALLEARVSEAGTSHTTIVATNGEPALITQQRTSTGSGSTSDASSRSSKEIKDKDKVSKKDECNQKDSNNAATATTTTTNTINTGINKRKRSVDESDGGGGGNTIGIKPSKKGKNGTTITSLSSANLQSNVNNNNQNLVQLHKPREKYNSLHFSAPASTPSTHPSTTCTSTSKTGSTRQPKLLPMKLSEPFTEIQVSSKSTGGYVLEVNNTVEGNNWSYQVHCRHQKTSFDGLTWTVTMDSPIIGISGDSSRIVVICENGFCHTLDTKGRYISVPFVLPNFPHRMVHSGAYLMIISVKATVHVWNLLTKKNVIRCESLLPILNDPGKPSPDITHCAILVGGVPLVVLSNGKSFKFNFDFQSWVLFVNISTSSHSAAFSNRPCPEDDEFLSNSNRHSTANRRSTDFQLLSQIKMKLTASIDMKKTEEVRTWMVLLGINLAKEGLESELRALCLDLLGPCHSAANFPVQINNSVNNTNNSGSATTTSSSQQLQQNMWNPLVVGIPKRDILRQLLSELAKNLRWQSVFTEFNTLLNIAESSEKTDLVESTVLI